jgi:hypothetical protein
LAGSLKYTPVFPACPKTEGFRGISRCTRDIVTCWPGQAEAAALDCSARAAVDLIRGNVAISEDVQTDTVQFKTLLPAGMLVAVLCNAAPNPSFESDIYTRSIREFGGNRVNPMAYSETTAGFQSYLTDSGVKIVSARELILPNHPDVAARLGFHDFLPPRSWWPRGAALALLTQRIEFKTNSLVRVRNWWRPTAYNSDPAVGGARAGDHPTASAVDLDYRTISDRMRAELFLRALEKRCPWLQLSLGLGALTTHVGIGSLNGHREWHYEGWRPPTAKRNG